MQVSALISVPALIAYAVAKLKEKRFDEAFSYVDRACEFSDYQFAPAIALRAHINQLRGESEAAVRDWVAALVIAPLEINYLQVLAQLCADDSARRALTRALSLRLKLRPEEGGDTQLLPLMRATRNAAMGAVWRCKDGSLIGWAVASKQAQVIVELDGHVIETACNLPTPRLQAQGIGNGRDGFSIRLPDRYRICRIGIDGVSLWGSPIAGNIFDLNERCSRIRSKKRNTKLDTAPLKNKPVDVIVPVYAGREDTLACLDALKRAENRARQRIIVVNDYSPDTALTQALRQRAHQSEILLLERQFNAGFVGAINTALAVADTHDVVLLNADACVQGDWLDRLQQAVYASADIATATPLSNNGEELSHPHPRTAGAMPTDRQAHLLDRLFCKLASDTSVDIPNGVGFCLYIRRTALDEVGFLDEAGLHRGYGEETEFCLRASAMGWRHVCAANVYVAHRGNVSFGDEKTVLARRNVALIKARFPGYEHQYDDFIGRDPLKPLRREVQREWLALLKPGLGKACRLYDGDSYERAHAAGTCTDVTLCLVAGIANGTANIRLIVTGVAGLDCIVYSGSQIVGQLVNDLAAGGIARLILGSVAHWPRKLLQQLVSQFEYHLQIEDYFGWCPRRYLLQAQSVLCDDPSDQAACLTCLAEFGTLAPEFGGLAAWRQWQSALLRGARTMTAPSAEMARRYRRRFADLEIKVKRSHRAPALPLEQLSCIAVPALLHPHQGFGRFIRLARRLLTTRSALRFVVLGEVMEPRQLVNLPNVRLMGTVAPEKRAGLLQAHRCQALVDFSPWPCDPLAWAGLAEAAHLPLLSADSLQ